MYEVYIFRRSCEGKNIDITQRGIRTVPISETRRNSKAVVCRKEVATCSSKKFVSSLKDGACENCHRSADDLHTWRSIQRIKVGIDTSNKSTSGELRLRSGTKHIHRTKNISTPITSHMILYKSIFFCVYFIHK